MIPTHMIHVIYPHTYTNTASWVCRRAQLLLVNWYRAFSVVKFQYVNKRGGTLWNLVEPCGTFFSAVLVDNFIG